LNTQTKNALLQLCEAVEQLAAGTCLTIGIQTTSEIISKARLCQLALEKDETIVEVS
jgi:hypothetical protein